MRCLCFGVMLLLAVTPAAVAADDKGKSKPDSPKASAEKELKDLTADFNKAQEELFKPLREAKTPEEAEKIAETEKLGEKQQKLTADFSKRAFAIVEKYAQDSEVVVDALSWIVNYAQGTPDSDKAVGLLIRDHLANKKIDALLRRLAAVPTETNEKLFRAVLEKADTAERKTKLRLELAKFLKFKSEAINTIKVLDDKMRNAVEQRVGKEVLDRLASGDPAKAAAEAEALFVAVVKEAGGNQGLASIKEGAEAELFELRHLAIGKQPPDIEGEDIDGKKFKLSDYRGKVVVLDFWGNW